MPETTGSGADVPAFYHGLMGVHVYISHNLPFASAEATPQSERDARYQDFLWTQETVLDSIDAGEGALGNARRQVDFTRASAIRFCSLGKDAPLGGADGFPIPEIITF